MSVSENSTLLVNARESDGSYQLLDDRVQGPAVNAYDKSPYTDPDFVSLDVGQTHTIFRVHRIVLSQSPELEVKPFSKLWGDKAVESIALPDIDEATAHTLVHYLYSGWYQTLYPHPSSKDGALSAYKLGTCVYVASVRYKLPGLANLAKEQINVSSEDLSILQVLGVARDHAFPVLPAEERWYEEYVEKAVRAAFAKDPDFFVTAEFVDQIEGDRRFRQVVMRAVVGSLAGGRKGEVRDDERMEHVGRGVEGVSEKKEEEEKEEGGNEDLVKDEEPADGAGDGEVNTDDGTGFVEYRDIEKPVTETAQKTVSESVEEPTTTLESTPQTEEIILEAIEPTPPTAPELESFTDEVGFGKSQTYRKMNRTDSSSVETGGALDQDEKVQRPVPERKDSLVVGSPRDAGDSGDVGKEADGTDVVAVTDEPISKKKKKLLAKKRRAAEAAAAAVAAEAEAAAIKGGEVV
ncbi:hypothetical protein B0J11DRAFT_128966 [Dendryphion nanum]|uniref:BTB domain-containing protein n=1 Tax=Dendryphion nanum TaxID=256645 RepID=A0A9P9DA98_9PLEO|nr:hypothetical protein B0J11DRAFT_128966 [Dendryphion nanum]